MLISEIIQTLPFSFKTSRRLFLAGLFLSSCGVRQSSRQSRVYANGREQLTIGQPGSATGYYFPIYNFYGLTLAEAIPSATSKAVLEAVAQGRADVGASSLQEFNTHKTEISQTEFRIVFVDRHRVPAGAILVSSDVELKLQDSIHQILQDTPPLIARQAGFIPQGTVPDYKYMVSVVDRVRSILPTDRSQLTQKPVRLFKAQ